MVNSSDHWFENLQTYWVLLFTFLPQHSNIPSIFLTSPLLVFSHWRYFSVIIKHSYCKSHIWNSASSIFFWSVILEANWKAFKTHVKNIKIPPALWIENFQKYGGLCTKHGPASYLNFISNNLASYCQLTLSSQQEDSLLREQYHHLKIRRQTAWALILLQ